MARTYYILIAGHGAVEFGIHAEQIVERIRHWEALGYQHITVKSEPSYAEPETADWGEDSAFYANQP